MVIVAILVAFVFAYVMAGAASFRLAISKHLKRADHSVAHCFEHYWCDEIIPAFWFNGLFWPFMIPATIGLKLGGGMSAVAKPSRDETRRAKEIAEAEHRVAVAKLIEEENQILDSRLKENAR